MGTKSKTNLIFKSISKAKKDLIKNLKNDNFPKPMSKPSLTNSSSTTDSEEHTIKPVSEDIFHKKNLIVNEEWNENDDMFFDQKTAVVANFDEFLEDKMLIEKNNKVCSEQLINKNRTPLTLLLKNALPCFRRKCQENAIKML